MKKQIDQVVLINFKRHENYKGEYNGRHFIISGCNGAGKTSIFDAIRRLLGQQEKDEKPGEPVRQGAEGATTGIYISKGGEKYYVEEKYDKKGKGRIRFYRVNGGHKDELAPALERLQLAIGTPVDFSPLMDMDGEEQLNFFKENLGLDLSMLEHNYDAVYSTRTQVNSSIKTLSAKLNAPELRVFDADKSTYTKEESAWDYINQKVKVADLYLMLTTANGFNNTFDLAASELKTLEEKEITDMEKVDEINLWFEVLPVITEDHTRARVETILKERHLEAGNALRSTVERLHKGREWMKDKKRMDTDAIRQQINEGELANAELDKKIQGVSEHNAMVLKVKNHTAAEKELEEKQGEAKDLTKKLQDLEASIFERLAELNLGSLVEGLELVYETFEDEKTGKLKIKRAGLYLENLPFRRSQHSYGKCIMTIIKLSAHFNAGKLNFISVGAWNDLDEDNQAEVIRLAKENPDLGIQLGIEKVDNNKQVITELIEI